MGREVGDGRDANRSVVMGGGGGGGGGRGYTGEGGVWWRGVVCSASSPRDDPGSSPRDGRAGYEFFLPEKCEIYYNRHGRDNTRADTQRL